MIEKELRVVYPKGLRLSGKPAYSPLVLYIKTKKGHSLYYGYKRHVIMESTEGLVLAVSTTKSSNHDSAHLQSLLDKVDLKKGTRIYANKGYAGLPNETLLKHKKLKSAIEKKATKNNPLSSTPKRFNKLVSKTRYKVEPYWEVLKAGSVAQELDI